MTTFFVTLDRIRRATAFQDDAFWDVGHVLSITPEIISYRDFIIHNRSHFEFITFDGFIIRLCFMYFGPDCPLNTYFNGYVTIPNYIGVNVHDFTEMQSLFHPPVEFTYGCLSSNTVGWDHNHYNDQSLCHPVEDTDYPQTYISGPVQVLEEALAVVQCIRRYFYQPKQQAAFEQFEEELIQRTWAPSRVATWIEKGFDVLL